MSKYYKKKPTYYMLCDLDSIEIYDSELRKMETITVDEFNKEERSIRLDPKEKKAKYYTGFKNEKRFIWYTESDSKTIEMYEKCVILAHRKLLIKYMKAGELL